MIPDIQEVNFPKKDGKQYATLSHATVSLADMGEKTITTQVNVDGDIAPDFSHDWEIIFKGEKYIMPLRVPQGAKDNTSINSTIDLTFQHWAVYQLKRWLFFTVQPVETGTVVTDQWIASVNLNLVAFCDLFGQVLECYFGDTITIDLNPGWVGKSDATLIEINYSYLWDVLVKMFDLFGVRWSIEPNGDEEHYVIKVGYQAAEIGHILQYGFDGGLLRLERQVQNPEIRNLLLGRGGTKNLPAYYFKRAPANSGWDSDPDWVPELEFAYFDRLRDSVFRDYIKGWKTNPLRQKTYKDENGLTQTIAVEPYDAEYARTHWAYEKGHTDARFNTVEWVKADGMQIGDGVYRQDLDSISRYGELVGGLADNDEIYPTIQGRSKLGIGRIDKVVAVEAIESDDVPAASESTSRLIDVENNPSPNQLQVGPNNAHEKFICGGGVFYIPEGKVGNLIEGEPTLTAYGKDERGRRVSHDVSTDAVMSGLTNVRVRNSKNELVNSQGLPAGEYTFEIETHIQNTSSKVLWFTVAYNNVKVMIDDEKQQWTDTFNIWIKDIWGIPMLPTETPQQYAERVWRPILGGMEGDSPKEAAVVFASGLLSTSEDYQFTIIGTPALDQSKQIEEEDASALGGKIMVPSHWRLSLAKSDVELEATGKYLPNTRINAKAGDLFFFVGIELPHLYVTLAEEALHAYKLDQLSEVMDIRPSWIVTLDRVRIHNLQPGEVDLLVKEFVPGRTIRIADHRFVDGASETLYIQSVNIEYKEPSTEANILPEVEVILSDRYQTAAGAITSLSGEVSALSKQIGALSNVEQAVRIIGDKLYLRKDGILDRSLSPTEFMSLVSSSGFRNGMVGGRGWGFFQDSEGAWVLETDRLNVRQQMQVNNLVINQISARGGMIIESAAAIEVEGVSYDEEGNYICYFNQKDGSVPNLFKVDDIAMAQRYDAEYDNNMWEGGGSMSVSKFYKRVVMEVGSNYIKLAKNTIVADHPLVSGDGEPAAGDVIVQYGNIYDKERQYVIVRDVVGGGYERFIEGLNSVHTDGEEYYFVGRQAGMYGNKARFYLGNTTNYIEYVNGELNIKAKINVLSTIGDKNMEQWVIDAAGGGFNYALGTRWDVVIEITAPISASVGKLFPLYEVLNSRLADGDKVKVSFDYELQNMILLNGSHSIHLQLGPNDLGFSVTGNGKGHFDGPETELSMAAISNTLSFVISGVQGFGTIKISNLMLTKSGGAKWSPSPADVNYLLEAMKQNTSIDGGLIQTSAVNLGYTDSSGVRHTTAGSNGIYEQNAKGGGLAFWAGGSRIDPDYNPSNGTPSTFGVRQDGTVYAAGNTVRIGKELMEIGDYLKMTGDGMDMVVNGNQHMRIGNYTVNGLPWVNLRTKVKYDIDWNSPYIVINQYKRQISGDFYVHDFRILERGINPVTRAYTLGVCPIGAKLSVFSSSVYFGRGLLASDWQTSGELGNYPSLKVELKYGAILVKEWNIKGTAIYGTRQTIEYNLSVLNGEILTSGDDSGYSVFLTFVNPTTYGSTLEFTHDGTDPAGVLNCTIETPASDQTTLGANGLMTSWGNATQIVQPGLFLARVGDFGLKITTVGIQIMKDGSTWTDL